MSHCGSDGDHRQGVVVKEETVAEPEGYFLPHVSDAWTTILILLVPTRTTHVPLSYTFTYDHHLPVPFLQLSVIGVDTERHASCVKVAELGLAMSRARPWMYRHHRTVRTTDEDSHAIIYILTSGPLRTSYLVTPSPPTSLDLLSLTAALSAVSARAVYLCLARDIHITDLDMNHMSVQGWSKDAIYYALCCGSSTIQYDIIHRTEQGRRGFCSGTPDFVTFCYFYFVFLTNIVLRVRCLTVHNTLFLSPLYVVGRNIPTRLGCSSKRLQHDATPSWNSMGLSQFSPL